MPTPYDEMLDTAGTPRAHCRQYYEWLREQPAEHLARKRTEADALFHRVGITFAVYGENEGTERLIPFDIVPRIVPGAEWQRLELGLKQRVRYTPGTTSVEDSAAVVFARGQGVCQDQAHVFVACCRAGGIPARYVSGYLCSVDGSDSASHAWVDAWLEDAQGWLGIDVTHLKPKRPKHCRLAVGRDYLDAAPVRGVRRGGGREVMDVNVAAMSSGEQ